MLINVKCGVHVRVDDAPHMRIYDMNRYQAPSTRIFGWWQVHHHSKDLCSHQQERFSTINWCRSASINHRMELRLSRQMMNHEISRASSGAKNNSPKLVTFGLRHGHIKIYLRWAWLLSPLPATLCRPKIVNDRHEIWILSAIITETCAVKSSSHFTIPFSTDFDLLVTWNEAVHLKLFESTNTHDGDKKPARTFWR